MKNFNKFMSLAICIVKILVVIQMFYLVIFNTVTVETILLLIAFICALILEKLDKLLKK